MSSDGPNAPERRAPLSVAEAKAAAQRIVFGPLVFQAAESLWSLGVLNALRQRGDTGATVTELAAELGLSPYALTVLCESGHAAGLLHATAGGGYSLSMVGWHILQDDLTRANFEFVRDVCYEGALDLTRALRDGEPAGLSRLAPEARTVYEALPKLSEVARRSWYQFDHFYSDAAFRDALELVLAQSPTHVIDVGANTGRWAAALLRSSPNLRVTLVDHEQQLRIASEQLVALGYAERFATLARDLTEPIDLGTEKADVVWLSQVLDCLAEDDIVRVLSAARRCLSDCGVVYVLEPCWDRQRHDAGAYCLRQISLYFACIANGQSRMYDSDTLTRLIRRAGLAITRRQDHLGLGHSLFVCGPDVGCVPDVSIHGPET